MSAGTDLTALIAEALRLHGTPLPNDGYPDDEYDCCAAHVASVVSAAYTITPKAQPGASAWRQEEGRP